MSYPHPLYFSKNDLLTPARHAKDHCAHFVRTIPKKCCKACERWDTPPSQPLHFSLFSSLPPEDPVLDLLC